MKIRIHSIYFVMIICFLFQSLRLLAQVNGSGIYIDPNLSDPTKRRFIILNSNNVESMVGNWGNVGQGQNPVSGVWPKGSTHDHIFEFTGFVASEVVDAAGNTIVIISDGYIDGGGTSGEFDPVTNVEYKYHPLPGYYNEVQGQDEFANSQNPVSWPPSWPGKDATWDGKWNGFFGQNQFNATQEAMYYIDDAWNKEFRFYPYSDMPERQGLGIQIHTRLFQWAHPLAKDILFYYFDITNAGNFDYLLNEHPIYFGGFGDIGPGGRGTVDDNAAFDKEIDLVYGWDNDNRGVWNVNRDIPPGYLGWKFLESPGIDTDGIDNDGDGLIDEKRDNPAGSLVFGPVGIYGEPKEHWSGDEDGDWLAEVDDVGADGIMEYDEGYPGPDADGTEGNGMPDQGEPNFGKLDNDESDQVGLTSFSAPLYGSIMLSDEEAMWPRIQPGYFKDPQQAVNQFWIFASGPVQLRAEKTERFSTCFVFAFTERALFQAAMVAQRIFDSDYRFAKEPRQPKLTAIPGDGKVTLKWDHLAELSRDPIYGFDFEGYRIFRSTHPQFLDVKDITDSEGNATFKVPLAQYDLDNGLVGPHPLQYGEEIQSPTGIHFYMGDDTGLKHYYVDTNVINGRTYYYAVTAYDKGYTLDFYEKGISPTPNLLPITPAECPAAITENDVGIITRMDPNTAIVTPNPLASDIVEATFSVDKNLVHEAGNATGNVQVALIDGNLVEDAEYEISFKTEKTDRPGEDETRFFSIYNRTSETWLVEDEEIPWAPYNNRYSRNWSKELADYGFVLDFHNQFPDPDDTKRYSGWTEESQSNLKLTIEPYVLTSYHYPISFVVEFGEANAVLDTSYLNTYMTKTFPVNFSVSEYGTNEPVDFVLKDNIKNGRVDITEAIFHIFKPDPAARRGETSWGISFDPPEDEYGNTLPEATWVLPQPGDKILVINQINFSEKDIYSFNTNKRKKLATATPESALDAVRVVPNPYIVSSKLEQQPALSGRGERFIRFINLPAQCTIRIYTVNGDLVRVLEHNDLVSGAVRWDLISKDGLEVAFGLYVYHIEAPGIGQKIDRFAIIN